MDLLIVGNEGGTNVGASLQRSAAAAGVTCVLCDARQATAGPRLAVTLSWRLRGHRPLRLREFSDHVVSECERLRPRTLIATGQAPLTAEALRRIGAGGTLRINYSTDDPWNPTHRAAWFLQALAEYDRVRSTRMANLDDFRKAGCRDVAWLPFGYDEELWVRGPEPEAQAAGGRMPKDIDVFFAGAAEPYRAECVRALLAAGIRVGLAGDYWSRSADLRKHSLGHLSPAQLRAWTRETPVSLCMVRRANRDGHVMRSFEIAALGGCMAVEDTAEHRGILGEDGEAVRYFSHPAGAVEAIAELLRAPETANRLRGAARARILGSHAGYGDRLRHLLGQDGDFV